MSKMFSRFAGELRRVHQILFPADFVRWTHCVVLAWPQVMRKRSLGPADDLFGDSCRVRFGNSSLRFAETPFGLIREIFGHRCYAKPEELRAAQRILDLGANVGVFSVFALAYSPYSRVHAVEAQPGFLPLLQANVSRNGYAGRHQAESAVVGGGWDDWTKNLMKTHPNLNVFDPDEFFRREGDIDFCKCDVEGAEFGLLRQKPRWLQRIRQLALEYHGDSSSGDELQEILTAHGFLVARSCHGTLGYLRARRP